VSEDDEVAVLEAMKMEMPIVAEEDGTVAEVKVAAGQTVEAEQVIIVLK
jgi:biotin carboxyl carrier protein